MSSHDEFDGLDEAARSVLEQENRYYQEVTITDVSGECPYGHKKGDQFKITTMNSDGMCGSLLKSLFTPLTILHYGGKILWEEKEELSTGYCPEKGKVRV